jgi:hypothetical protein
MLFDYYFHLKQSKSDYNEIIVACLKLLVSAAVVG